MQTTPAISNKRSNAASEAIIGLFMVVLTTLVVAGLYFGREVLIPVALAALLTFMLSPLVSRIEKAIGRVPAVVLVTLFLSCVVGALGWVISRQAIDLASKLPDYRYNIEKKIHSLELSTDGPFKRLSRTIAELEAEIPGYDAVERKTSPKPTGAKDSTVAKPLPAPAAPAPSEPLNQVKSMIRPLFNIIATAGIVMVLVIFMLLRREDLRGRLIKILGRGSISTASRAMEDAGTRVSKYLVTQLIVNVAFGTAVTAGLFAIGVPNASLWGALAGVLRFIPYVGAWIAALGPILLSLAISPDWNMVGLTIGLFAVLEMVTGNFVEPMIYGASTGVSSLGLIIAAIFWTWLWGPIGLLLSTPLTVCVAVMGRHVPRLSFFSTLLGSEEALTPAEDCYHRLLVGGLSEAGWAVDQYIKTHSLTAAYDDVLINTISTAEMDFERGELEDSQRMRVLQGSRDIIEELNARPPSNSKIPADQAIAAQISNQNFRSDCRVVCVPTRGERDQIAGEMLAHLVRQQGFEAVMNTEPGPIARLAHAVEEFRADVVCISVVPPSSIIQVRHLCSKLRTRLPSTRIIVGLWGATENLDDAIKALRASGADEVAVSLAEAVVQLVKFSSPTGDDIVPAKVPADEEARLGALNSLEAYTKKSNPEFDQVTKNLARTFDAQIALVTLIDREHQHFKSQAGLPAELASMCEIPRGNSICAHAVAANDMLVVEDLRGDRRFANNPLIKKYRLRFYAGAPIHARNGQPVGAICIMDTKPRHFSESDQRLLAILAEQVSANLLLMGKPAIPAQLVEQKSS